MRPVCAMLIGSHKADSISTSVVFSSQPDSFAAHDAGERLDALVVGDDADGVVELVGLAVEREQFFAGARAPHDEIAVHLGGIEHMQRPAAVIGDEVGDIDQRVDRTKPDRRQPLLQPFRRGAVLDAAHQAQREARAERRRGAEIELHLDRAGEGALHGLRRALEIFADAGRAEIARNAGHAGAIGAVGGQVDFEDRFAEVGIVGKVDADRRVVRQIDDAFVIVGKLQFGGGTQHAAAFDAANGADAERDVLAGDEGAGRREHALHAGACIGRPADDLHRVARPGIDHADAQPVGIRMLLRLDHARDGEGGKLRRLVLDLLDLEPDHGELVGDRGKRFAGVEMLFQPGESEFHRSESGSHYHHSMTGRLIKTKMVK